MLSTTIFAPRDSALYPPCGMFTIAHFIVLALALLLVAGGWFFCRRFTENNLRFATKCAAIAVTVLESVKIGYNFAYGYTNLDAWLPLAFCSLFIYATWLAGFGKGVLEKLGKGFLVGGCPTAGTLFLIFPTTSLQMHPVYHYLCIYSMLYHGAMLWLGGMYLVREKELLSWKSFGFYAAFFTAFAIPSMIINSIANCNMMFLREPFNIPLKFVESIYHFSKPIYSILIFIAYLACYLVSLGVHKLMKYIKEKQLVREKNIERI